MTSRIPTTDCTIPTSQTCNDFSTFLSINYENKLFRKIQLIQESKNFENTNETV